nr:hypothetical protein [Tanacetum cinerariifolium]
MRVHKEEIPKTDFMTRLHELKGGARVAFEDEFGAVEEREVLCEAQKGQSGVQRKLFGTFRNKMGYELILTLPEGSDNFVVIREARVKMRLHELKGGARVAFEDEFGAVEEREVLCEAQKGQSGVQRKLFGTFRNKMGYELILTLPEGSDNFVVIRDVRTLIIEEAYATKCYVRPRTDGQSKRTFWTVENMFRACVRNLVVVGILTFREAEIRESKMIGLEIDQETTKVVMIKERLKEAKDHQES